MTHTHDERIDAGHLQSVTTGSAWAVSIEVDGRQKYLFETDKLQEVVGASAIMRSLAEEASRSKPTDVHVFQPASGEVRAWSTSRASLLRFAWALREWLTARGVEHTAVALGCREDHFVCDRPGQPADERTENRQDEAKEPVYPDLAWVHRKLTELAGRDKSAKSGYDARPTCSLFESCRLHGMDFANEWNPAEEEDAQGREKRRALRGYRAKEKFDARQEDRVRFIDEHVRKPLYKRSKTLLLEADRENVDDRELRLWVERYLDPSNRSYEPERPIEIGNLVLDPVSWFDSDDSQQGTDQFVAFMCADGDGIGRLLTGLDWNRRDWANQHDQYGFGKLPPWERNLRFSKALDHEVREAFHAAVAEVTLPDKGHLRKLRKAAQGGPRFIIPALPQIQGGDDLWTIVRKDVALQLCRHFARNMRSRVKTCPILSEGIRLSSGLSEEDVSMSQGVAFAKAGYPVHAMIEAAESLLDSAKTLRKGKAWKRGKPNEGCLDWHWIESSLSETVADARAAGTAYVAPDTGDVMLLTTRPWTHTEAEEFECAANLMMSVPRRKREQLDDILRRGYVVSLVAWEAWWNGLRECERRALRQTSASLSEKWRLPDLRCEADVVRAGCEARKWRKHLPVSPWIHVESETKGEKTTQYYITPLLDLIAMDGLAELDDARTSEKQGATSSSVAPPVRETHG